jgi:hypothetical protein
MPSPHFFWTSLLLWIGFFVFTAVLITQLVFPASFGILPAFRLWKLAFNSILLIGWIAVSGYFWKTKSPPFFVSPSVSFGQALIRFITVLSVLFLFVSMEALTNGQPLDFSIGLGLSMGLCFSIISIFMYWRRRAM